MGNFTPSLRTLGHCTGWALGSWALCMCLFGWEVVKAGVTGAAPITSILHARDWSAYAVSCVMAFLGTHRTLGHFTFLRAADDFAHIARNEPWWR